MMKRKLVTALLIFLAGVYVGLNNGQHTIYVNKWNPEASPQTAQIRLQDDGAADEATKVAELEAIFTKYHSPLASQSAMLVAVAARDNLDYRLLPAIAFTESTLCLHYIPGTFNCLGYGSGYIHFGDFEEAESDISASLASSHYYAAWRKDPADIGLLAQTYNASDTVRWTNTVIYFMNEIEGR